MGSPLRLGIFSSLQQVSDRQAQRAAQQQAVTDARDEKQHKRAMEDLGLQRQATLDQAGLRSRSLEDELRRQQIGALRTKSAAGPKSKMLPSNAIEKMVGVDNMRSSAEDVQRSLEDAIASHTNATGSFFGFKTPTRLKNMVGMGGEKGQRTRNIIGSLKGTIAKERAGTSMTPSELDLLESYIPSDNDDESVALSKARDFIHSLDKIKQNRMHAYQKYGYGSPDSEQQPEGADDEHLPHPMY